MKNVRMMMRMILMNLMMRMTMNSEDHHSSEGVAVEEVEELALEAGVPDEVAVPPCKADLGAVTTTALDHQKI